MQLSVRNFAQLTLGSLLVTLPLLVLPHTEQFVVQSKMAIFIFATFIVLGLYVIQTVVSKMISFTLSPLTGSLLFFGTAVAAATFFTGNYPVEHLVGMGGVYLAFVLFVLFGGSIFRAVKTSPTILNVLLSVNTVLLFAGILQLFGFGPATLVNYFLPAAIPTKSLVFNLAGSTLVAAELAVITLVGLAVASVNKQIKLHAFHAVAAACTVLSLGLYTWALLPGKETSLVVLPWSVNWSIAVDTLRAPRTALIGFGPSGFTNAYNIFRPSVLNVGQYFGTGFTQGSNVLFTLMITTGLLGLISFISLFYVLFKQRPEMSADAKVLYWMAMTLFGLMVLLPANVVLFGVLAILLTAWIATESKRFSEVEIQGISVQSKHNAGQPGKQSNLFVMTFSLVLGLLVLAGVYGYGRAFAAEMTMFAASKAGQANDIVSMYELQQKAIALNPYMDTYRIRYSVTNLSIASALAGQENPTEEQTAQFSQLVQQAIREARAATALDELDAGNWLNLAQVYRSLIGVAQDAQQWTTTSYITAIQLAPSDPGLRLELGGVLYAAKQYPDAIQFFQQAVNLKPDLANGYYNLANAYVKVEQWLLARSAYQQTLQLLQPDSENYTTTMEELDKVQAKIKELGLDEAAEKEAAEKAAQEAQGGAAIQGTAPSLTSQNAVPAAQTIAPSESNDSMPTLQGGSDAPQNQTIDTPNGDVMLDK